MCYCNSGVPHITPSTVAAVDGQSSAADLFLVSEKTVDAAVGCRATAVILISVWEDGCCCSCWVTAVISISVREDRCCCSCRATAVAAVVCRATAGMSFSVREDECYCSLSGYRSDREDIGCCCSLSGYRSDLVWCRSRFAHPMSIACPINVGALTVLL